MAGITDTPFRQICLEGGAGLVCAEMVSACALKFGNKKTMRMLEIPLPGHPVSMQIFGGDETAMMRAVKMAERAGADIIDINAGCPVKKILRSGSGAALMKDERLFARLIRAVVSLSGIPVTVKIRTGWKSGDKLSLKFAKTAESEGADAVTVHARPVEAVHSGRIDVETLAETAAAVKIPVIGNGAVACAADAVEIFNAGCAGVMIGRAAIGNPWIFSAIKREVEGGNAAEPSFEERACMFLRLAEMNAEHYGERTGIFRIRKTAGFWFKGFNGAGRLRSEIVRADTLKELQSLLK